jgi:hypothetical protein
MRRISALLLLACAVVAVRGRSSGHDKDHSGDGDWGAECHYQWDRDGYRDDCRPGLYCHWCPEEADQLCPLDREPIGLAYCSAGCSGGNRDDDCPEHWWCHEFPGTGDDGLCVTEPP